MMDDIQQKAYADQVTAMVHGFVQVWIKFEAMVHEKLAENQNRPGGIRPESEPHANANYGLFYRVSSSIYQENNPTMGELSNALSVPLSTATRIVDWLVTRGYVQRLPDPEDRRVVRVALTDKGQELHRTIARYIGAHVQQILSCLTVEEQTTLFALIQKVVSALKEVAE